MDGDSYPAETTTKTLTWKSPHDHSFTYSASGATITATCSNTEGCPLESSSYQATLIISAAGGTYDGTTTYGATVTNNIPTVDGVTVGEIEYYKVSTQGATTGGTKQTGAPTDAGYYYASVTLTSGSNSYTAVKAFTISPKALTISGATLTARNYAEDDKNVTVSAVTFKDNAEANVGLTLGTDYTATAEMANDTAGSAKPATVTVTLTNGNYSLAQNTYTGATVQINKIEYTGSKTAAANLRGTNGATAEVTLPALPAGASYGAMTNDNTAYFTVGAVAGGKVTVTAAKNFDEATESAAKTFTVAVSGATNYNDYSVTVTITPIFKAEQTITAENVTATYGDTGKSVSASVTTPATGGGAISYAVKSGSEDYIDVDATGALTIKKAGTATVVVTAAETGDYAQATKDVTVTINKAAPVMLTPTAKTLTYTGSAQKLVNDGSTKDGTMQYASGTDATTAPIEGWNISIPEGTEIGNYYVWYKVAGDENHSDTEAKCVTVSIAKVINLKPILSETKIVTTSTSIQINGFYNAGSLTEASYQFSSDGGKNWTDAENSTTHTFSGLTGGTTYQLRVRTVATAHTEGVETSDILSVTTPAENVSLNNVSISGDAKVGNTLSAKLTPTNATSVTYQWYRGDVVIEGATYSTYALTKNDYGQQIKVVATQSGIAKTSEAVSVDKAPAVAVANSSVRATATNTSITVTAPRSTATRNYEYSLNGQDWQLANVFSVTAAENDTGKTVYARTGGADWQGIGTEIGQTTVSVPGKPYPFDSAPTVVAQSFEYQSYTGEKAPALNAELETGAATPAFQYRVGTAGTWQSWTADVANSLPVGSYYYMRAVIEGNATYHAYTTEPVTFAVTKSTTDARTAPTAPVVSSNSLVVTIAAADRGKALEYQVDGTTDGKWVSVPTLDSNGQFTLGALSATSHTINLRYRADSNYEKPSASLSASFTLSQYSVAYDANGGSNAPAPQMATSPATITVYAKDDKAHTPTRSGYAFAGWYDAETGGSEVTGTLNESKTLYAHWTANTYTVAFNANGGTGTMTSISNIAYDAAQTLTANAFSNGTDAFVGWATSANGSVVYTDGQSVKNLTSVDKGTVTLYAVWVDTGKKVNGDVESEYPGTVELKLMRGGVQVGGTQVVTLTLQANGADAGKYIGDYSFTGVPNGTYNLIAMQIVAKAGTTGAAYEESLTRTAAITVSGSGTSSKVSFGTNNSGRIVMPSGDVSSIVDVKEDTPPVIVGGLDNVADQEKIEDRSVNVTLSVESQDKAKTTDEDTKDAIDAIENLDVGDTEELSYINIGIEKEVVKDGTTESKEAITETSNVITITIPYDMTGRSYYQVNMYRHHDNKAERFPDANRHHGNGAPTQTYEDGHFYIDVAGNMLYLYAKKFSTYAISFDPGATAPATTPTTPTSTPAYSTGGGSSDSDSYLNTVVKPSNGTVSVNRSTASNGEKVTITIKPDTGYMVDTVTVSGSANRSISVTKVDDTTYTYIQPGMDVKINVTFRATSGAAWADCPKDVTCPISAFTDADLTAWYHDGVHYALEKGIMSGYGNGNFGPSDTTSRAMMAQILYNLEGKPAYSGMLNYTDVDANDWYAAAIRWANAESIIDGYGKNLFGPNDVLTREQLVTILYRYAKSKGVNVGGQTSLAGYHDAASVSGWAEDAMQWAVAAGIITGKGHGTLDPKGNATRSEIATIMMRYCENIAK